MFLPPEEVVPAAAADPDARSFDAPGADYTHRGDACTFEVLIQDFDLGGDPALRRLAAIVHAADVSGALDTDPLGPGLLAIGEGGLDAEQDDQRLLERGVFVYDALYAWSAPARRRRSRRELSGTRAWTSVASTCCRRCGPSRTASAA